MVVLDSGGGGFFGHSRIEVTRWMVSGGVSGNLFEELELMRWRVGERLRGLPGQQVQAPADGNVPEVGG